MSRYISKILANTPFTCTIKRKRIMAKIEDFYRDLNNRDYLPNLKQGVRVTANLLITKVKMELSYMDNENFLSAEETCGNLVLVFTNNPGGGEVTVEITSVTDASITVVYDNGSKMEKNISLADYDEVRKLIDQISDLK